MLKLQCEETGSWLANGAPVNSYGRKAFRYVFNQTYTVSVQYTPAGYVNQLDMSLQRK